MRKIKATTAVDGTPPGSIVEVSDHLFKLMHEIGTIAEDLGGVGESQEPTVMQAVRDAEDATHENEQKEQAPKKEETTSVENEREPEKVTSRKRRRR